MENISTVELVMLTAIGAVLVWLGWSVMTKNVKSKNPFKSGKSASTDDTGTNRPTSFGE